MERKSKWNRQRTSYGFGAHISFAIVRAKPEAEHCNAHDRDTGWDDFGAYSGGRTGLGRSTPNVDRLAREGALFTSWYGHASCPAGRASFMTGRIPIRSALSVVTVPGDANFLRPETPTHRRALQEERVYDVLLGQVASGLQT
jgi:Sulfatase